MRLKVYYTEFMDYILTVHAEGRMLERATTKKLIEDALRKPTKIMYDNNGKLLIKKLYKRQGKERLLLIAGEIIKGKLKIFTIIDTSKIKKYL